MKRIVIVIIGCLVLIGCDSRGGTPVNDDSPLRSVADESYPVVCYYFQGYYDLSCVKVR